MPTLNLSELDLEMQLLNLTAIMCWPLTENAKEYTYYQLQELLYIAETDYKNLINDGKEPRVEASINIGSWLGEMIYEFGSWPALADATIGTGQKKSPVANVKKRLERGVIIGWIFKDVLKHKDGISNSAERYCSDETREFLKERGVKESKLHYAPKNIQSRIWPKYKDAAHLWAAFISGEKIIPDTPHRYLPLNQFRLANYKGIKAFIDLSEEYRKVGLNYYTRTGPRKPLLDEQTSWQIII